MWHKVLGGIAIAILWVASAAAQRFIDNGDGTVTDTQTALQWEKKTGTPGGFTDCSLTTCPDPHELDNTYQWCLDANHDYSCDNGVGPADGGAFTDFLGKLNSGACFAGQCDWRLPTVDELQGILLAPYPCATSPCIDATFGPTQGDVTWSSTTDDSIPAFAWFVSFYDGRTTNANKPNLRWVRAVRSLPTPTPTSDTPTPLGTPTAANTPSKAQLKVCGDDPGEKASVASIQVEAAAQCPCDSFAKHGDFARCVRGIAKAALASGTLTKACYKTALRDAAGSTCGRALGAVTCCETAPNATQSCKVKASAAKCLPKKGGSAAVGQSESCYDACLPALSEVTLDDVQVQNAVVPALNGVADPWGNDSTLARARILAELGTRDDGVTPVTPSESSGRLLAATSTSTCSLSPSGCIPPPAGTDCFYNYCCDSCYCGAPSNSRTVPQNGLYWPTSDCLNRGCLQHDLSSFGMCVSGSRNGLTGMPIQGGIDCYFSAQSAGPDAVLLQTISTCIAQEKQALLTCVFSGTCKTVALDLGNDSIVSGVVHYLKFDRPDCLIDSPTTPAGLCSPVSCEDPPCSGIGQTCDAASGMCQVTDSDGDGVPDSMDACPGTLIGPGVVVDASGCACYQKTCSDGNVCTDDSCDPLTAACAFTNNTASCSDGNACTLGDHCSGGTCISGSPPSRVCGDGCVETGENCGEPGLPACPSGETCRLSDCTCQTTGPCPGVCTPGQIQACSTSCGTTGTQTCSGSCSWGSCVPPAETCNGIDDDCNGIVDDPGTCWRAIYRYQNAAGARCLGPTNAGPPAACAGYSYEIEAFIVATNPVPGTFHAVQCSNGTDHIVVPLNSSDWTALRNAGYSCDPGGGDQDLGYIYNLGSAPTSGRTPWANTCNLWRYRYNVSGGGAHLFTRGADSVGSMTCEDPARGQVFTNFPCFSGTAPGC
jgi:hypothetical protein